ncbi:putative phospholipid ABC transporter permease protein MlaE [Aliarcobacter thereius]|uniref:MlaE family ABC transporter permease n=1 Tax=Aliarcobacter thereius TaxID=544718 RepID=UPI00082856BB|nr:ABC transporter permease [Aliarcobacter thereius]OCL88521.1 putative phospholipid ABC transporter permease protein MlaE [Aliarcobacter thereius]
MKKSKYFILEKNENNYILKLQDEWNIKNLSKIVNSFKDIVFHRNKNLTISFKDLKELDSSSAIFLVSKLKLLQEHQLDFEDADKYRNIFLFYWNNFEQKEQEKQKENFIYKVGEKSYKIYKTFNLFIVFVGELFFHIYQSLFKPKKIRVKTVLEQIENSAYKALIIVVVTSFLVGVVIAYQGAVQLEKFGANIFVVEMISISMFREIAPLITAIVIAGRSASSYTAEIGAMKITDEIDAMKTMGFEPALYLTLPRVLALAISLPLLVFLSDIVGIMGGMLVAFTSLDITYLEFINRLQNEVPVKHLFLGVFKAFVFGIFIALIACFRGFQVQNNTTSIGKYTTMSVVNAIFMVILLDAVFSVIFTEIGI